MTFRVKYLGKKEWSKGERQGKQKSQQADRKATGIKIRSERLGNKLIVLP